MLSRRGIYQLSHHETADIERLRQFAMEAADVLKRFPKPDTFMGRKTQEPFPVEPNKKREKTVGDYRR
jgi:hypothetical protein